MIFLILCYSLDYHSPSLSVYLLWSIWSPQPLIGIIPAFEFCTIQLFCLIKYVSVLSTWESNSLCSARPRFCSYFHGIIASQNRPPTPLRTWYAGDRYLLSKGDHWLGVLAGLGLSVQARAASVSQTLACIRITWKTCWNWFLGLTASNQFSRSRVGPETLYFWWVPRWYGCCWSTNHTLSNTVLCYSWLILPF